LSHPPETSFDTRARAQKTALDFAFHLPTFHPPLLITNNKQLPTSIAQPQSPVPRAARKCEMDLRCVYPAPRFAGELRCPVPSALALFYLLSAPPPPLTPQRLELFAPKRSPRPAERPLSARWTPPGGGSRAAARAWPASPSLFPGARSGRRASGEASSGEAGGKEGIA